MGRRLLKIQDWEQVARAAKFRPEAAAALCQVSLRQLERFSGEYFKKTPRELFDEQQLQAARRLISQGWSNQAVVDELGFADASHFCHKFKRFYGVSPQNFAPVFKAEKVNGYSAGGIKTSDGAACAA